MKKKLNLVIKQQAEIEILESFLYYEDESDGLGERFLNELDKVFHAIQLTPKGFKKFYTYRQAPLEVFPYVVVYEVTEKSIIIFAVFLNKIPKRK